MTYFQHYRSTPTPPARWACGTTTPCESVPLLSPRSLGKRWLHTVLCMEPIHETLLFECDLKTCYKFLVLKIYVVLCYLNYTAFLYTGIYVQVKSSIARCVIDWWTSTNQPVLFSLSHKKWNKQYCLLKEQNFKSTELYVLILFYCKLHIKLTIFNIYLPGYPMRSVSWTTAKSSAKENPCRSARWSWRTREPTSRSPPAEISLSLF